MSYLYDQSDNTMTCPYNVSHRILSHRFQTHLVKCKKNYPDVRIVECPFNSTHKIAEPELRYHVETCVDRLLLDRAIYVPQDVERNRYPIVNVEINQEENWEDENVPTYNPQEHIAGKEVLRHLDVASGASRRDFRLEERYRHSQFQDKTEEVPTTSTAKLQRPVTQSAAMLGPEGLSEPMRNLIVTEKENVVIENEDDRSSCSSGKTFENEIGVREAPWTKCNRGRGRRRGTGKQ